MGYATEYNRQHAGTAWEIIGYLHDGDAHCVACAELIWVDEALAGADNIDDGPAALFSVDASTWRDGGDHGGGCGLSCDPCGAIVIEACAACVSGIGGAV